MYKYSAQQSGLANLANIAPVHEGRTNNNERCTCINYYICLDIYSFCACTEKEYLLPHTDESNNDFTIHLGL